MLYDTIKRSLKNEEILNCGNFLFAETQKRRAERGTKERKTANNFPVAPVAFSVCFVFLSSGISRILTLIAKSTRLDAAATCNLPPFSTLLRITETRQLFYFSFFGLIDFP